MIGCATRTAVVTLLVFACAACSTQQRDYSTFRAHQPESIVVLPPLNETVEVNAPYSFLSTISMPLAEVGYYVFPVAVVDQMLKDNGLPTPGEMHTVSPRKLREVIGADAVLYVTIREWGQKYQVLASTTRVSVDARLVDTDTSTTLWEGSASVAESSGGGDNLIAMLVIAALDQVVDSISDRAHGLGRQAAYGMLYNDKNGVLVGHRSPKFETDQRGY
jgi:hypothetical protein